MSTRGFTIVELLIVIVVIGILAAISIVAFNGVQKSAAETALRSELAQNEKGFELERTTNTGGTYNPQDSDYRYRETPTALIEYSYGTSESYCMNATSKHNTNITYYMSRDQQGSSIHEGTCPEPNFRTDYRCIAGKVYSYAVLHNDTSEPLSVRLRHSAANENEAPRIVEPGSNVSQATTLRLTSVPRGVVTFSTYDFSGKLLETYYQASEALTCS
jgi:prepilin-type N-terminal cleavage/methylation domain-containing protein